MSKMHRCTSCSSKKSSAAWPSDTILYGNLKIDKQKCIVYKNGVDCNLTATEYKLLLKLLSSPERVFTKNQLYESIRDNYQITSYPSFSKNSRIKAAISALSSAIKIFMFLQLSLST